MPANSAQDENAKKLAILRKLEDTRRKEEENRARQLSSKLGLPYLNLLITPIEPEALALVDEKRAKEAELAIIKKVGENDIHVAVHNSEKEETKNIIAELNARNFKTHLIIVSPHSLEKAWRLYKELAGETKEITGRVNVSTDLLKKIREEIKNIDDIRKKIQQTITTDASKIVEMVMAGALSTDASDIHLETKETEYLLRYRIDGLLRDVASVPLKNGRLLLSRIKLLSEMKLNVHDVAQDGRFTVRLNATDIENRVSIIPGAYGENVVIRILNPEALKPTLKDIGLRQDLLEIIEEELDRPDGMFVTTGPTGSGKTTALYAFLKTKTSPDVKIITLEDPIEYHLPGIVQTQVESERGYTFASGLRAILRQDPDIILLGEIRDKETAETAVQAALTGHLVFSTLHTNDAAGAVPRFLELGAHAATLANALNLLMAQRLIRKICPNCKEELKADRQTIDKIKKHLKGVPKKLLPVDIDKPFSLYQGNGCATCDNTGYKSRSGIFELIRVDHQMELIISKGPSHAEMLDIAIKNGFISMYQDGLLKVLSGMTTVEEVDSVTQPAESFVE